VSCRWRVLLLLFLARCVMGMQFESIGALGPMLKAEGLDYGQLGILIGAYLAPGFVVALPGGVVVQRLGDRRTVLLCLALMAAGGIVELDADWIIRLVGRVLAGTGGVVLTVAATKMIVDRFTGKDLATAMAVFVNSWPCGIALALVCLPPVAQAFGSAAASTLVTGLALLTLLVFAARLPATAAGASVATTIPAAPALAAVCVIAVAWGIANAAFATVFGFGPALLVEKGYAAATAANHVSAVLWVTILAIPVGGAVAARQASPATLIVACTVVGAALVAAVPRIDADIIVFVGIGVMAGLPGAAIMSLPARVLPASARAVGMGIFYSIYYGIMLVFPVIEGVLARRAGSAGVTFDAAAVALLVTIPMFAAFIALARLAPAPETAAA
jgi:predicted MFS family arabinose efflux permease